MELTAVRRAWPLTSRYLSACARSLGAARAGARVAGNRRVVGRNAVRVIACDVLAIPATPDRA